MTAIPPLKSVYFYLTWRCNLRCVHCWVEGGEQANDEYDFALLDSFTEQVKQSEVDFVRFTGGEPLLCWDKLTFVVEKLGDGMTYSLETNGLLLDQEKIDFIKKHDFQFGISLNGFNAETNDGFMGRPGAFDQAMHAVGLLKENGVALRQVVTCVNNSNIDHLEKRIRFFDSLGFQKIKINPISSIGRAAHMDGDMGIEDHQNLIALVEKIRPTVACDILLDHPMCLRSFRNFHDCGLSRCGLNNLISLLPDGSLSLCGYGGIDDSVILDKWTEQSDLQQIWQTNELLNRIRSVEPSQLQGACKACLHKNLCQGDCKIASYHLYHRWDMPLPLCQEMYEQGRFPKARQIPFNMLQGNLT